MNRSRAKATPYLFIAPYFLIYAALGLFPMLFSLVISFTNWDGITKMTFAGFNNYIRLFTSDTMFYQSLLNTLLIIVITLPLEIVLGLGLAAFLKDFFGRSRNVFQLFNFLPYVTTPVAVGIMFQIMFDYKNGTVNNILGAMGINSVYWLGIPWASRFVVILMYVWTVYGYKMILFLSGMSTIPDELYEAAKIDGARWKDSFFHITLPLLKPIMTFVVTTSIISGCRLFDQPQLLFQSAGEPIGGPNRVVLTVVMRFYEVTFKDFNYGYGSAMAYILFIIIAIFSFISIRVLNRGEEI